MTHLGEIEEDLDEGVVADHMRTNELGNFDNRNFLQFSNIDKNTDPNWVNILIQRKASAEDSSPHVASHMSPEPCSMSDLASFDYSQRLPSLESSSSVPIGRCTTGMASHPFLAWQPFGSTPVHPQGSSSLHVPGVVNNSTPGGNSMAGPGHLFPVSQVSTSTTPGCSGSSVYGSAVAADYASSPPSDTFLRMRAAAAAVANSSSPCYQPSLLTASDAGSGSNVTGQDALQPLRMVLASTNQGAPSSTGGTPVPSSYAASASGSFSTAAVGQPTFLYNPSTGSSTPTSSVVPPATSYYDDPPPSKAVSNIKQRSKKESHNRIERKRRDYINAQIVYLSSLLPPELYRDVDGRRNKGSVLRLSVNYIMELRETVAWMNNVKQENSLARELIPLLIKRIEALERILVDQGGGEQVKNLRHLLSATSPTPVSAGCSAASAARSPVSLESLYQSWLMMKDTNQRTGNVAAAAAAAAASTASSGAASSFGAGGAGSTTSPSSSGSNSVSGHQHHHQQQQVPPQASSSSAVATSGILGNPGSGQPSHISPCHLPPPHGSSTQENAMTGGGVCYPDAALLMMAATGAPSGDTTDGLLRPGSSAIAGNPLLLVKREQMDINVDRLNHQQHPHHHPHQQRGRRVGSTVGDGGGNNSAMDEDLMNSSAVGGLITMDDVNSTGTAIYDEQNMASAGFEGYNRMMQSTCQPQVYSQNN